MKTLDLYHMYMELNFRDANACPVRQNQDSVKDILQPKKGY